MHKVTMLGTGLIGMFYTMTIQGGRSRDKVEVVYSRTQERAEKFAKDWNVKHATTDMAEAINRKEGLGYSASQIAQSVVPLRRFECGTRRGGRFSDLRLGQQQRLSSSGSSRRSGRRWQIGPVRPRPVSRDGHVGRSLHRPQPRRLRGIRRGRIPE